MENLDSDMPREGIFFGTSEIHGYLLETSKWAKFLAIVGYVGIGLMIVASLFVMVSGAAVGNFPGTPIPMSSLGLIYLVFAALYFFPVYYLYQFSVKIREALSSQSLESAALGFQNLKSLYKFMGIFMIIILSMYALMFVGAMVVAAVAGS